MRAIVLSWIAGGLLGVVSLAQGQEKPAPLPLPPHNTLWNPHRPTPDNPPLRVKVLVLNYDPLVPSEQHRAPLRPLQVGISGATGDAVQGGDGVRAGRISDVRDRGVAEPE